MEREIDERSSIRVVTSNTFITAGGLDTMTLKARKLLYIAIAQCRQNDKEFYEYQLPLSDFANMMGIDPSNLYQEAHKIRDELLQTRIVVYENADDSTGYTLFSFIRYNKKRGWYFKINQDMTDCLLQLKGNFTQPLLEDFLKMRSPYSMEIWHLMQREMHSRIPNYTEEMRFYLSLEELRKVTGTENKLIKIDHFKQRVLNKAIEEIKENCGVNVTYTNRKTGRTVIGFDFIARNITYISPQEAAVFAARMNKRKELREIMA